MLKKIRIKNFVVPFLLVVLFAAVAFSVFVFWDKYSASKRKSEQGENLVFQKTSGQGKILGEEEETYPNEFKSDRYRLLQLAFGGGLTAFYPGLGEPLGPLDIGNVQSEIVRTKDKKELQLVIKWKTERPTACLVAYGKSGGSTKSLEEEFFAVDHSAVLEKLDSASTYFYTITAKDKLGGEATSDKFAVYTGAPEVSFFDLLVGAFKDAFSWAVK